jgi:DNA-binding CsgD family transcriptional regulator
MAAGLAAEGLSNREIAERLSVTVNTIKVRLKSACRKSGTQSCPELKKILARR